MEKEEKGVTEPLAPAESEVKEDAGASAAEKDETDYKVMYEAAVERETNYKRALSQKRQLHGKPPIREFAHETEPEVEPEVDDDRPLTRKEFEQVLQERVVPIVQRNSVAAVLADQVKDPEKRKLVELLYETRVRQTGTSDEDIRRDIGSAIDMVDAERLRKVNAELMKKRDMEDTTPTTAGSGADRGAERKNHGYSDEQIKALTERARAINADPAKFIENTWKNDPNRGK